MPPWLWLCLKISCSLRKFLQAQTSLEQEARFEISPRISDCLVTPVSAGWHCKHLETCSFLTSGSWAPRRACVEVRYTQRTTHTYYTIIWPLKTQTSDSNTLVIQLNHNCLLASLSRKISRLKVEGVGTEILTKDTLNARWSHEMKWWWGTCRIS